MPRRTRSAEDFYLVNRYFSLAWHNEWMSAVKSRAGGRENALLRGALDRLNEVRRRASRILGEHPGYLDYNLQYHWCHFVTQYSTWMREWSFKVDPNRTELLRVASGSGNARHHADLANIVNILVKAPSNPARLRNLLFLLGTRSKRISEEKLRTFWGEVRAKFDGTKENDGVLLTGIFELCRQGYINEFTRGGGGGYLGEQCLDHLEQLDSSNHSVLHEAWEVYVDELKLFAHPLDQIPSRDDSWTVLITG